MHWVLVSIVGRIVMNVEVGSVCIEGLVALAVPSHDGEKE